MTYKYLLPFFSVLFIHQHAYAQTPSQATEQPIPYTHAISLHGTPKYSEDFIAFDYANPNAPKGGKYKQGIIGRFDSLNTYIDRGTPALNLHLLDDTLLARSWDEPHSKYGLIAQYIRLDPNNNWVEYTLNPKATFSDGTPITAEDVRFSHELLQQQGSNSYKPFFQDVKEAVVISPDVVRFNFKHNQNRELPLSIGRLPILAKHYWQNKDFSSPSLNVPVSSGPYRVKAVDAGRSLVFERRTDYWGKDLPVNKGRYNVDILHYEYFQNQQTLLEALKQGEHDIRVVTSPKIWHEQLSEQQLNKALTRSTFKNDNPQVVSLVFNSHRPYLAHQDMRKAISYAFDVEWANKQLFHNMYTPAKSLFAGSPFDSHSVPTAAEKQQLAQWPNEIPPQALQQPWQPPATEAKDQRHRQHQALTLFKQQGWQLKNKRLVDQNGRQLELELLLFTAGEERMFGAVQKAFANLGIKLNIRSVDIAQYIERLRHHNFDLLPFTFHKTASPGMEQMSYWHSDGVDSHGTRNLAGVNLASVDYLSQQVARAPDYETLQSTLKNMDRAILWNYYVLPLWYQADWLVVHKKHLKYPDTAPPYIVDLYTWWIDPAAL